MFKENEYDICVREDFDEFELLTGTCKHLGYCQYPGSCPLESLTAEKEV